MTVLAQFPPVFAFAIGGIAGAIIGSFLATLAIRWPAGRSAATGRSACDRCGRTLSPLDLVPLLSWLALRGRCRRCGARIDPLHPAVEAACAAIGAACLWLSPDFGGVALALLGWSVLLAAVLDARHFWLPHRLSLAIAVAGLASGGSAMAALGLIVPLADRAIGALAAVTALTIIAFAYRTIRERQGLGGGDAPFLAALATWIGWQPLPLLLLFAALAGLAIVATRAIVRGLRSLPADTMLPFGTLLALALAPALWAAALLLPRP